MDLGNRIELIRALVGSHNYNLNTETSDKDYKLFVSPTFDDLYFNKSFAKCYIGEQYDYDVHDIRKLTNLWWKSNVNFLEVLFSEDFLIYENIDANTKLLLSDIYTMRNTIARMNLPYLYNACIGMHISKKKLIGKGTEGTQHLVDKYGYDTKQAMHSVRILDFLIRLSDNNFTDFKKAIWYEDNEATRRLLLNIKSGKYSQESFEEISHIILNKAESYKDIYMEQEEDEETRNTLIEIVKQIVKYNI